MSCIAIDLHCDCFTTARRKSLENNSIKLTSTYSLKDESFAVFKNTLKSDDFIAVEATTNAFWFYDQVAPLVKEVFVLDVNKIHFQGHKTDKKDAIKLLDVLEYYVYIKGLEEIPCVTVPKEEIKKLRELFSTYRLQKKLINQLLNRVYSILRLHGKQIKKSILKSKHGREEAKELIHDDIAKIEVTILLSQLKTIEDNVKILLEIMANIGNEYLRNEIVILLSIPGFTYLTALALLTDIGDVKRFSSAKKFCSYLRVAPVIKESNNTTHIGSINKCSRSLTITVLTQSINHFRNCSPYFGDFYTRLKSGKSYGKTRVALIRKILVCCYYMLKREEPFKWSDKSDVFEKTKVLESKSKRGKKIISKVA